MSRKEVFERSANKYLSGRKQKKSLEREEKEVDDGIIGWIATHCILPYIISIEFGIMLLTVYIHDITVLCTSCSVRMK